MTEQRTQPAPYREAGREIEPPTLDERLGRCIYCHVDPFLYYHRADCPWNPERAATVEGARRVRGFFYELFRRLFR